MNGFLSLALLPLTFMVSPSHAQNASSHYAQFDLEDLKSWYSEQLPHHRDKRFLWMTHKKKIVFPPGTQLVLTPTLAMPLLRYPPQGLDTNLTISTPFTIKFDRLGLTDNENPIGLMPFLNPGAGILGGKRRKRRILPEPLIEPEDIHGGERALLYEIMEDFMFKLGMDGNPCLLRAICEMHESPLMGYGLFGEMLELILTASKSPYSRRLSDYIEAERQGKEDGECWRYFKDCPKSLFSTTSRYSLTSSFLNFREKP
ncbi:uncharacterized protein LOC131892705 [Tigriopus californicus]|uniref:uncharacterized protein LOC131892705 n=1 Tax=Tigriopus californicus TaxID=6832 RepID=UPI0027DA5F61|nr:uncharacterized protein LOC131892705 [Tigriopus californicus]